MTRKPLSRNSYRNLTQNRGLSEEDFNQVFDRMQLNLSMDNSYEKRIQDKIKSFGEDYDLEDLKANDILTLRALAQAYIALEDYELWAYKERTKEGGINMDRMIEMEKLGNIMSGLRKDISNMQADLNITRKVRKGDKQETVISELEKLKEKAKEFYKERMSYIWCDKCLMLLATAWFHYPDDKGNKIRLVCNRILDNGERCGNVVQIGTIELMSKRGVNVDQVPDFFK